MAHTARSAENLSYSTSRSSVAAGVVLAIWATSIICGQLVRLPLFSQAGGILPSDFANVLVIVYALVVGVSLPVRQAGATQAVKLSILAITPFLIWSLFVLCIHVGQLSSDAFIVALSYWMRLATTLALLPSLFAIFQRGNNQKLFKPTILFLVITLVALGYIQLLVQPSLQGVSGGWDPHNFRMVSTWLDPNFFGIFLAMLLPFVLVDSVIARSERSERRSNLSHPAKIASVGMSLPSHPSFAMTKLLLSFVILPAILLTQSRSTFLAIIIATILCGALLLLRVRTPLIHKRLVILIGSILVASIALSIALLGNRATNIFLHDPTVSIRSDAYKAVWRNLVEPNILLGVGYNAYQFAARDAGVISDFTAHSRAGSDSSVLTLLVTTGVLGTALLFAPILAAIAFHLRKFLQTQNPYSLCFLFATIALLVQSQFTNSLLYPHILMTYIFLVAGSQLPSPQLGRGLG